TPSGEFHVGHLREILTAEMIHRACLDAGMDSRYIFIVDSMDPLRRVYDFLSPSYEQYIGHPLAYIPAPGPDGEPDQDGGSYAEHFLAPFLAALKQIGVEPEVVMNHESYESGAFTDKTHSAIEQRDEIRRVIEEVSGREVPEDWFPYNPLGSDGSIDGVSVTGYEHPHVHWVDSHGVEGKSDIRTAQGKLPWRIDWAAKWGIHGITCEPAGKDHGAAGGSYDTGIPICEMLGSQPPHKLVYEWIQLKGMGAMSSSTGLTVGPMDALALVPPEIMRYVIARSKVGRHIDFDTGPALFQTADEYERLVAGPPGGSDKDLSRRQQIARDTQLGALRFSQVESGSDPADSIAGVSFRHLAMLAQIKSGDDDVWDSLRKSGHLDGGAGDSLKGRLRRMRNWVDGPHFPDAARVEVQTEVSEDLLANLTDEHRKFLSALGDSLKDCEWTEKAIGDCIRSVASEAGIAGRESYVALYWIILGKNHGPKASSLMAEMESEHLLSLIREV
ncbi:MAG: lysine--tRNA ligase, partial [Candidatus Thermoplasmatota archaeon]|nr:lysine--tRNA ligase [Candidatus Thermoplasmatota archaeon]